ncbi:MAG: type II secretion system protein, partial [Armatimonadetes bacterium]|nr:type II secretion system protein [Armatimonadota bacterium]
MQQDEKSSAHCCTVEYRVVYYLVIKLRASISQEVYVMRRGFTLIELLVVIA